MKIPPRAIVLALLGALPLSAQAPPRVDQKKVDEAIKRGVAYLRTKMSQFGKKYGKNDRLRTLELVLYTFVHAGLPEEDPDFKKLFTEMMETDLESTYNVSLQAMILESLDSGRSQPKYTHRILQGAQFLLDNQAQNGQWSYGEPTTYENLTPTTGSASDIATGARPTPKGGTREEGREPRKDTLESKKAARPKIHVKRQREGPGFGDNSNSQYAALGVRACYDAGMIFPPDMIARAAKWWRDAQKNEANTNAEPLVLGEPREEGAGKSSTVLYRQFQVKPQGWCYGGGKDHEDHKPFGSMTTGAIGGLAIYDYLKDNDGGRRKSWKSDPDILEGLQWLNKNFTVAANPGADDSTWEKNVKHHYYYLYALERVGMLYGTEFIGKHEWYPEGVAYLLEKQGQDGSWNDSHDTCFAILFLRRATKRLVDVATHAAGGSRKP